MDSTLKSVENAIRNGTHSWPDTYAAIDLVIHANWIELNKGWISLRVRLAHVWFVRRCLVGVNYTGFIVMQIAKSLKGCMFGRIGLGTTGFLPWLFCLERMEKTINYWEWSSLWQKILAFLRREYICEISKSQVVRVGSTSKTMALNTYLMILGVSQHFNAT